MHSAISNYVSYLHFLSANEIVRICTTPNFCKKKPFDRVVFLYATKQPSFLSELTEYARSKFMRKKELPIYTEADFPTF